MDKRIFMLLGAVITIGGVIFLLQKMLRQPSADCFGLSANVTQEVLFESGDSIEYSDATADAKEWLWEFGDGNSSNKKQGKHLYTSVGDYRIILTVNGSCIDTFFVSVTTSIVDTDRVKVIVEGPKTVYTGERVQFKCKVEGATKWSWRFGETGLQDSKEQNPYYTFNTPNTYKVTVATDKAKTPGELLVTVLPPKPKPTLDGKPSVAVKKKSFNNDYIRKQIDEVARTGSYSSQYTWIKQNFLYSVSTPIICNLEGVDKLEILFERFATNSGIYTVEKVTPVIDEQLQMITSLQVVVKQKNEMP